MAGKDNVHLAGLKDIRQHAHPLIFEMPVRGMERRMVKSDEAPGGPARSREVLSHPGAQRRGVPIDVTIAVKDGPMRIAVVEREISHAGVCGPRSPQKRRLVVITLQYRRMHGTRLSNRPVEGLVPIQK